MTRASGGVEPRPTEALLCCAALRISSMRSVARSSFSFFIRRRMSSRFRLDRWSTKSVPSRWSVSCWTAMERSPSHSSSNGFPK